MSFLQIRKIDLLTSNTKIMLISNTHVTFKYKCYLFLQETARHTRHMFLLLILLSLYTLLWDKVTSFILEAPPNILLKFLSLKMFGTIGLPLWSVPWDIKLLLLQWLGINAYFLGRKVISLSINSVSLLPFFLYNVWEDWYWYSGRLGPLPIIFLLHDQNEHSFFGLFKLDIVKLLVGHHFSFFWNVYLVPVIF